MTRLATSPRPSLTWLRTPAKSAIDPRERIAACRAALDRGVGTDVSRTLLLDALVQTDQFMEAVDLARSTARQPGADPHWDVQYSFALVGVGEGEAALAVIDAALQVRHGHPGLGRRRLVLLIGQARDAEADAVLDDLLAGPDDRLSPQVVKWMRTRRGAAWTYDLALARPNLFSLGDRLDCTVQGLLVAGRTAEALALMDIDRLLLQQRADLAINEDVIAFNARLGGIIATMPRRDPDPDRPAKRAGLQDSDIHDGPGEFAVVLAAVRRAVDGYLADPARRDSPFIAAAPAQAILRAWTVTFDTGGQALPHSHPAAWLSGVYYVSTPDVDADAGALLAPLPPDGREPSPWETRTLTPRAGEVILFPAYFRHRTLPHRGARPRICIAFDILPRNGGEADGD